MVECPTSEVDEWVDVCTVLSWSTATTRMDASSPAQIKPTVRILKTDLTDNPCIEAALQIFQDACSISSIDNVFESKFR